MIININKINMIRRIAIAFVALGMVSPLAANAQWASPTQAPPGGNATTPLNTSSTAQVKSGGLSVGSFVNNGGSYFVGSVGIGTATPATKLDVWGSGNVARFGAVGSGGDNYIRLIGNAQNWDVGALNNNTFGIAESDVAYRFVIAPTTGNVGIGTTNPVSTLQIGSVGATGYTGNELALGDGTRAFAVDVSSSGSALYSSSNLIFSPGSAEKMRIDSSGSVGIGTASPQTKLQVIGNLYVNNTSDATGGLYYGGASNGLILGNYAASPWPGTNGLHVGGPLVAAGTVKITSGTPGAGKVLTSDATGLATWETPASSGGTVTGTGATNYIPKWTSSTALGQSIVYETGSSVGINNTAPTSNLHVNSAAHIRSNTGANGFLGLVAGGGTTAGYMEWYKPGPIRLAYMGYQDLAGNVNNLGLNLESGANFTIGGGNVGIGTSPSDKLHVSGGAVRIDAGTANSANDGSLYIGATNNNDWGLIVDKYQGTATEYGADIRVANTATYGLRLLGSSSEVFRVGGNGNGYFAGSVGIGTASPDSKLDVRGVITAGSTGSTNAATILEANYSPGTDDKPLVLGSQYSTSAWSIGFGVRPKSLGGYLSSIDNSNWARGVLEVDNGLRFLNAPAQTTAVGSDVTGLTERFRVDASGNVGIGTNSPAYKLDVWGSAWNNIMRIYSSGSSSGIDFMDAGGTRRGVVYSDGSGFGLLTSGTNWALRIPYGSNEAVFYGPINGTNYPSHYLGTTNSRLFMYDSDESTSGPKSLHANSNVIGLLNGGGSWLSYWDNGGTQYQTGNTNYGNYGAGPVGVYASTRYQNVFSMGPAYAPAIDGTVLNNMYGLAWTHENVGGQSKPGLSHQLLVVEAGTTKVALGSGIWTAYGITAGGTISGASFSGSGSGLTGTASGLTAGSVSSLSGTWDGTNYFRSNKGAGSYVGSQNTYNLEAYSGDGGAAGMSFHRGGYYAVNMGLDPDNVFRIGGWSASANRLQLDMSGNLTLAGAANATAFYYTSDKDLKENIAPLSDSLSKILKLRGVSFNWKEGGKKSIGVIAQDVEKVYPEIVKTDEKTGLKSVEYGNLVAPLIEAIKEQQKQIDELKKEVELLKAR